MDAKYEEVIKQNVEILSDLKLTRAEVSQMKQKMVGWFDYLSIIWKH